MQTMERAFLYILRKKGKSLLLLLVLLLLSTLVMIGFHMRRTADLSLTQLRQSMGGSFRMAPDMQKEENRTIEEIDGETRITYTGVPLDEEQIRSVMAVSKAKDCNAVVKNNAILDGELRLVDFNGKYQSDPVAAHLVSIEADTSTILSSDFQKNRVELTKGNPLVPGDEHLAVISEALARQNSLQLGDEISLSPREGDSGIPLTVKIKGFFSVEVQQPNTDVAAPVHLLENRIFLDLTSAALLTDSDSMDFVDFFVDDPAQVIPIIETVQENQQIKNNFLLTASIAKYESAAEPLLSVSNLTNTLLLILGAASIVVLSLIQILFNKARLHEIGVMLSIGISKPNIILQRFMEVSFIAVCAYILSFVLCFAVMPGINTIVFDTAKVAELSAASLSLTDFAFTCGCGLLVIFLSTSLANIWSMRLSPKQILSQLS